MTATPTQPPTVIREHPPSRRNWLLLSLVAVLLVVVAGGVGWWIGSSGSEDTASGAGSQEEPTRSDLSSPAMIQQTMAACFSYVDYTNIENLDVISEGDKVVVVSKWEGMSATHQRSSKTPFSTTVVDVFELRDGLIAQCDVFFDYSDVAT